MRRFLYFLFLLMSLFPFGMKAQSVTLSPQAEISVLTCASGDELYALFGHTAIRVSDPVNGVDTVYNFGAFDFSTPNFYLKFVKGDMQYFVTTGSYGDFLYEYHYLQRSVYEQRLNLTQEQKQAISDRLLAILGSEERFYTYKFIDRNCTTMVADIVSNAIGHPISLDVKGKGETNRKILYGYIQQQFYANLGISIMFGAKTDRELYKVYLPMQFMESLEKTKNGGSPLVKAMATVYDAPKSDGSRSWWDSPYTYAVILLVLAFNRNSTVMLSWLMVSGLLGTFLALIGLYSFHEELALNYNAFLFCPVFVLLVVSILMKKPELTRIFLFVSAGCIGLYLLYMLNKPHLLLMLPIALVNGLYLFRIYKTKVLLSAVK